MKSHFLLGIGMVAVGIGALLVHALSFADTPPTSFQAADFVEIDHDALARTQPEARSWPLIVAQQFLIESPQPPEAYEVRVGAERGAAMLRFQVTGTSSRRTTALAAWLADSCEQSLRQSLPTPIEPGLPSVPLVRSQRLSEQHSAPIAGRWLHVAFDFFVPALLVAGGVTLWRSHRYRGHRVA